MKIMAGAIVQSETQQLLSDLNQAGDVDVFDALIGLRHIVGLLPSLEKCGPPLPAVRESDISQNEYHASGPWPAGLGHSPQG